MWDELVSTAIVGTAGQAPPPGAESESLSAIVERLNGDDREAALLAAAGLTSFWRLAGSRPPKDRRPMPAASEPELAPILSRRAGHCLERMLAGQFQEALPEFLEAVASVGAIVPPHLLPDMLDVARGNESIRPFLSRTIGRRGAWLSAQNPLWSDLTASPDEAAWETGKSGERTALLSHLRATDPAKAIELLRSTWDQESAKDRPAFLNLLNTGLSSEDEPFLEGALSDSRIEVRRAATSLLARLPNSRLAGEASAIVFSGVDLKTRILGKARLDVDVTDEWQKRVKAARIEPEPAPATAAFKSLGEKAKLLYQLVAITPVAAWSERFRATPERLIEAAIESDWSAALLAGWTAAVGNHPRTDWTRALIRYCLSLGPSDRGLIFFPEDAIKALPRDAGETLIAEALAHGTIAGDHPALWLISAYPGPWSDGLSRTIIKTARRHVPSIEPFQTTILDSLAQCAFKMPPGLAAEFASGWPVESGATDRTIKLIDEFVSILTFRRDMLQAIHSKDEAL
jgi:hypothetical protein